jgi:hypothetical protein
MKVLTYLYELLEVIYMYELTNEEKNKLSKFIVDGSPDSWLSFAEELMESAEIFVETKRSFNKI